MTVTEMTKRMQTLLEVNTSKCLNNRIEALHTYLVFEFVFICSIHFIEIWVTGMSDSYLPLIKFL